MEPDSVKTCDLSAPAIDPLASHHEIIEVWLKLQAIKSRVREYEQATKAGIIAWLKENGRELRFGDTLLYVGAPKKTRCRDVREALTILLERYSIEDLADLLAADAFKHGAAKKVMRECDWDQCFEVTVEESLETTEIQVVDTRFLPRVGAVE